MRVGFNPTKNGFVRRRADIWASANSRPGRLAVRGHSVPLGCRPRRMVARRRQNAYRPLLFGCAQELDFGAMGAFETPKGRWAILFDSKLSQTSDPLLGRALGTAELSLKQATRAGDGARLAMLVLHDDETCEYAYGPVHGFSISSSACSLRRYMTGRRGRVGPSSV